MKDRGSALFTSVVAVMVLLLISGVFFALVIAQSKTETSEEKGLKAYYLAEAGISAGVADVLNRRDVYFGENPPDSLSGPDSSWQDYGGGTYKVKIEIISVTDKIFKLTSTGYYPNESSPNVVRKIEAQYTLP